MMGSTLRSRLWLGYILLTALILGAFLIGLIYILNGSTILYRQVVDKLTSTQAQLLMGMDTGLPTDVEKVKSFLSANPINESVRVLVISPLGSTLYDSNSDGSVKLRWLRLAALKREAALNSSGLTRDYAGKTWIYLPTRMVDSPNYLVVASLRNNLSVKFVFSDPMMRMILRVFLWSMLVSFILTLFMDRWIARPIREISQQAINLAMEDGKKLPVEGIREIQDLARSLNEMSMKVQMSRQAQRDLVSDISHELKTPLTSIQGFSTAIIDGTASSPDEVLHSAEVISKESQRMLGMVNELLALARLESRVDQLDFQVMDIKPLIDEVLEKLRFSAQNTQVKLISQIPNSLIANVVPEKMTQVLNNLIENAIKFTPPGGRVTVSGNSDDHEVEIVVSDTGMGIQAEELPKIFNRFYQVDRSRKANDGKSSGLGLTIAREIVLAHHGDITVESTPGKETVFTVHLPAVKQGRKKNL